MLKALLGFVAPDAGRMRVLGLDVADVAARDSRAASATCRRATRTFPGMNAVSFVAYCGQLAGLPRVDAMQRAHEVLYYVGLGEARYRNVETYSTGMKQRIKLAQALVHDPDLLFLDEPTNGMDPKGRDEMLELIRDLAHNKGVNLILSSHLLPDVEYTCDHVVVLDKGRVAAQGPIDGAEGAARAASSSCASRGGRLEAFVGALRGRRPRVPRDRRGRHARVRAGGDGGARELFALAAASGVQVRHLRPSVPTLEDVFARRWGRSSACPFTIRAIGATAAAGRRAAARGWSSPRPASARSFGKRAFLGLLLLAWVPFVVRAVQIYAGRELPAGRRSWRRRPRRSASSSSSRSIFVFFVTIYVGAGLIANDRRANALQIYLSKPLTRAEYIAGKLGDPGDVPAARHLGARASLLLVAADRCSPATSRSCGSNLFLFPAITLFSFARGAAWSRSTMLALSSLSKSSRFVAILYAGVVFFTQAIYGVLRVVTAQHVGCRGCRSPTTSQQVGDVIFRLPPRVRHAVAGRRC